MNEFKSVETIPLTEPQEFLDYLSLRNPRWGSEYDCSWIFRGQRNAVWGLQPRAWRPDGQAILKPILAILRPQVESEWAKFYERRPMLRGSQKALHKTGVLQAAAEYEAVWQFSNLADELGYPVLEQEEVVSGTDFIRGPLGHSWPEFHVPLAFCLAQHHGVPTRLLDWTSNPMTAAFFAAEPPDEPRDHIAVWALDISALGRHNRLRVLRCPRHQHSFLHAQNGLFIWDREANTHYHNNGGWPRFEELIEQLNVEGRPPALRKITLPAYSADSVLQLLWRERVSLAHLMPTPSKITQALLTKWRWADSRDT